jgi:hypothetical protein
MFAAMFASAGLVACGGGGGGSQTPASVTVGAPQPAAVTATVWPGEAMANLQLTGSLFGDVEGLQGKPVYVVVEDPSGLFESNAELTLSKLTSGWQYTLRLTGKLLSNEGRLTGALKVRACLDAACNSQLDGTPLQIPYDVTVPTVLQVSPTRVEVTLPFGTVPPLQQLIVSAPYSTQWVVSNDTPVSQRAIVAPTGYFSPSGGTIDRQGNGITSSSAQVDVLLVPAPPGTYSETLSVSAQATGADGRTRYVSKDVEVVYTVTPDPSKDHLFWPARLDLVRKQGDPLAQYGKGYLLITPTGVTAQLVGVEYFGAGEWWGESPYQFSSTCVDGFSGLRCLPVADYAAQVRYRLTTATDTREVLMPISMTITP